MTADPSVGSSCTSGIGAQDLEELTPVFQPDEDEKPHPAALRP